LYSVFSFLSRAASLSSGVAGSLHAIFIEAFGTAFLTFVIFAVTNPKNNVPASAMAPLVGTAIGMMVALLGFLTGAGINPARDLGPRIVTSLAGWGAAAFTDVWVYLIGPLIGGPIGAYLADRVVHM
jgi:glycerol uptake facilitator protein